MLNNIMIGLFVILLFASVITGSPFLCLLGLLVAVFGFCGFYQKEENQ